jgi:Relaxase/Mobilisation nuclease domain
MIGNCYQGSDFSPITTYLLSKPGASRIGGNMIFFEPNLLIKEFNFVRSVKPYASKPVIHVAFSLPAEESLLPKQWQTIADRYMKEMKLDNNQYITVRHTDTPHDHIHLLASRIRLDRKLSSVWQNKRDTQNFVRQIEKEFNLQQIPSSWETPERPEKANSAARRDFITSSLDAALNLATDLDQLREHLRLYEISMRETKKAGVTVGITYRFSGTYFTASSIDRPYSAILEKFDRNQRQALSPENSVPPENPTPDPSIRSAGNDPQNAVKTPKKSRGRSR